MKENKRIKLTEEVVNEVTLQTLLKDAGKAEIAVMALVDNCMMFNSTALKKAASDVKSKISSLSDAIRQELMSTDQSAQPTKQPLDQNTNNGAQRLESEQMDESDNLGAEAKPKMDELVTEAKKLLKRIIESEEDDIPKDENGNVDTTHAAKVMDAASAQASAEPSEETDKEKKIDLREPFANAIAGLDDENFQNFKTQVADSLKASGITDPEFQEIVTNIEGCENVDDFNFVMDRLYDYADNSNILIETEKAENE